MSDVVTLRP